MYPSYNRKKKSLRGFFFRHVVLWSFTKEDGCSSPRSQLYTLPPQYPQTWVLCALNSVNSNYMNPLAQDKNLATSLIFLCLSLCAPNLSSVLFAKLLSNSPPPHHSGRTHLSWSIAAVIQMLSVLVLLPSHHLLPIKTVNF